MLAHLETSDQKVAPSGVRNEHRSVLVSDACVKMCRPSTSGNQLQEGQLQQQRPVIRSREQSPVGQAYAVQVSATTEGLLESDDFVPIGQIDQEVDNDWPMCGEGGDEAAGSGGLERRGRRESSLMCETLDQCQGDLEQYFPIMEGPAYFNQVMPAQQFAQSDNLALSHQNQQDDNNLEIDQHQQPFMWRPVGAESGYHQQQHQHHHQQQHQQSQQQQQHQQQQHIEYGAQTSRTQVDGYHHYSPMKYDENQTCNTVQEGRLEVVEHREQQRENYYDYRNSTTTSTPDLNNNITTTAFAPQTQPFGPQNKQANLSNDSNLYSPSTIRCCQQAGVTKFDSGGHLIEYRPEQEAACVTSSASLQHLHSAAYHEHRCQPQVWSHPPVYADTQVLAADYGSAHLQTLTADPTSYPAHNQQHYAGYHQQTGPLEPMEEPCGGDGGGKTYHLLGQQSSDGTSAEALTGEVKIDHHAGELQQLGSSGVPRVSKLYDPTQELSKCLLMKSSSEGDLEDEDEDELWSQASADVSSPGPSRGETPIGSCKTVPSGRSTSQSYHGRSGASSRTSGVNSQGPNGERRSGCRPDTLRKLRRLLESRRATRQARNHFPQIPSSSPSTSRQQVSPPSLPVLSRSRVDDTLATPHIALPSTLPPTKSPPDAGDRLEAPPVTPTRAEREDSVESYKQLRNRTVLTSPADVANADARSYGIETRASKRRRNEELDQLNSSASCSAESSSFGSINSSSSSLDLPYSGDHQQSAPLVRGASSRRSFSGSNSTTSRRCHPIRSNSSDSHSAGNRL